MRQVEDPLHKRGIDICHEALRFWWNRFGPNLWRAVDHEGEVLEVFATKQRDRKAALAFLKRTMKRYGRPRVIVTDRFRSYGAAMKVIGNAAAQECGRWRNNRAENSHRPFRRRERAMAKFRDMNPHCPDNPVI